MDECEKCKHFIEEDICWCDINECKFEQVEYIEDDGSAFSFVIGFSCLLAVLLFLLFI